MRVSFLSRQRLAINNAKRKSIVGSVFLFATILQVAAFNFLFF